MAVSKQLLREHLSVYFKYFDNDYNDLKKMLGIEPLQITILRTGTFDAFRRATGRRSAGSTSRASASPSCCVSRSGTIRWKGES